MSCIAHLAGGPIVIVSLLARLSILPWGNCNTYSTSYSWWILPVSRVWPLLEGHVNAISKHVCGNSIFNKSIWSTMLNFCYQLFKHRSLGNVMNFLFPNLNGSLPTIVLGKDIPLKYVFKHIFLSIVLFNLIIIFSFPLVGLTFWWSLWSKQY